MSEAIGERLGYSNTCVSDDGDDTCLGPSSDDCESSDITMHTGCGTPVFTKSGK